MNTISLFDAKNRLSALVDQVEEGQEVTITRRGKPVARLVPVAAEIDRSRHAVERLRALRETIAKQGARVVGDALRTRQFRRARLGAAR
jgi:prevent-host-death family protein